MSTLNADIKTDSTAFTEGGDITVRECQQMVHRWITTVGVRYFSPLTNMTVLTEEVGEVARIMARRYGEQSCKNTDSISDEKLADELADVLWVVMALANQTGTDLTEALRRNIRKKNARDRHRHRNNPALQGVQTVEPQSAPDSEPKT